jgi:hypothetical protein
MEIKDLTCKKFGKLTVIERAENDSKGRTVWKCVCDCGGVKNVRATSLNQGLTRSCGCLAGKHGYRNTRIYTIWCRMKDRCFNKNNNRFHLYGGRGISVCEGWASDFMEFREWAINSGYSDDLSIDRIDNDGDYCPENCRWATVSQQNKNRRPYKLKNKRKARAL